MVAVRGRSSCTGEENQLYVIHAVEAVWSYLYSISIVYRKSIFIAGTADGLYTQPVYAARATWRVCFVPKYNACNDSRKRVFFFKKLHLSHGSGGEVHGVLNYMSYRNKSTANIDPSKVEMLAYICTQINAKVVITSSWRGSETYTPRIYYILLDILKEHHVPVLGDAPYIEGQFTASVDTEKSYSLDEI